MCHAPVGRSHGQYRWQEPETLPGAARASSLSWQPAGTGPREACTVPEGVGVCPVPVTSSPATRQPGIPRLCFCPTSHLTLTTSHTNTHHTTHTLHHPHPTHYTSTDTHMYHTHASHTSHKCICTPPPHIGQTPDLTHTLYDTHPTHHTSTDTNTLYHTHTPHTSQTQGRTPDLTHTPSHTSQSHLIAQ